MSVFYLENIGEDPMCVVTADDIKVSSEISVSTVSSSEISCEYCNANFTANENLYRHLRKVHPNKRAESTGSVSIIVGRSSLNSVISRCTCQYCHRTFSARKNLYKHVRRFHPKESAEFFRNIASESDSNRANAPALSKNTCKYCNRVFTAKKNLNAHVRKQHPTKSLIFARNAVCSICGFFCRSVDDLQSHIGATHSDISLSFEEKEFDSVNDFEEWKTRIESESLSRFVKHSSNARLTDGTVASYYYCHRSGIHRPNHNRKRRMKCNGTNKIGKTCPANMKVYKHVKGKAVKIKVKYQSVHAGHRIEICRAVLTKTEKQHIANQLNNGVSKSELLRSVRAAYSPTKRISFISRKDLHNICRDYNVEQNAICKDMNDLNKRTDRKVLQNVCHDPERTTVQEDLGNISQDCNTDRDTDSSNSCVDRNVQQVADWKAFHNYCRDYGADRENDRMNKEVVPSTNIEQEKAAATVGAQNLLQLVTHGEAIEQLKALREGIEVAKTMWIVASATMRVESLNPKQKATQQTSKNSGF